LVNDSTQSPAQNIRQQLTGFGAAWHDLRDGIDWSVIVRKLHVYATTSGKGTAKQIDSDEIENSS
jgi:hypothetical protein